MTAPSVHFIEKNPYGMKVFTLDDPTIQDRFVIRVSVPASYEMRPDARYPVLYVLDGDASMGLATTALDYINLGSNFGLGKNVPDMIVVGIGYERGAIPWLLTRVRDFTPTVDASFNYNNPGFVVPASGGAEAFYAFLTRTLIPTLQANFRTDPSLAVLAGHSMGALFALWAMLKSGSPFHRYIAVSPFVGWDGCALAGIEERFAASSRALPARLFLSSCSVEPTPTYLREVRDYHERLSARHYDGFECRYAEYPEENHFSVVPKAFTDGLYSLFA